MINKENNIYRPEIDGLRALAVLSVIFNHFNKSLLPNGYLGVDIFFVISGFVVTSSLSRRKSTKFSEFFISFYKRRIRRILPPLLTFIFFTSIILCLFNPIPNTSLKTGITSIFGMSNFYLLRNSTDYFAQSSELMPFLHTWSLSVEEQFYFIYPFLIWGTGFAKDSKRNYKSLLFIILSLTILSFCSFSYFYISNQSAAYFLMPNRFWEIGLGCAAFLISMKFNISSHKSAFFLSIVSFLTILLSFTFTNLNPVLSALAITISTCILILTIQRNKFLYSLFTNKKIVFIGLISYSLYLWHWGVLSISRITVGVYWWTIPFQSLIMFYLSKKSYDLVEVPSRSIIVKINKKILLLISFLITFISIFWLRLSNPFNVLFLGNENLKNNYSDDEIWDRKKCGNSRKAYSVPSDNLLKRCWLAKDSNKENIQKIRKNIFMYGNSYNEQLMPIPTYIYQNSNKYNFNSYFSQGCISSLEIININEYRPRHCANVFEKYLKFFQQQSKEGDVLLIANSYDFLFTPNKKGFQKDEFELNNKELTEIYINEIINLSKQLNKDNKKLMLTNAIPVIDFDPRYCSSWFNALNRNCIKNKNLLNSKINLRIKNINQKLNILKNEGIIVLDIYGELIKKFKNNDERIHIYYYNGNHLSKKGALKLKDYFQETLLIN